MAVVLDRDASFAAVDAMTVIDRARDAFLRHAIGEWRMPSKLYLDAPPGGDFRAMPASGSGLTSRPPR